MNTIKKNTILIIFLCAILLIVLYNFRLLQFYLEYIEGDVTVKHPQKHLYRLQVGLFKMVVEFVVFLIVAFFNFSWINKLTRMIGNKNGKILNGVVGNVLLFIVFYFLEKYIFHLIWQGDRPRFHPSYYLILNLSVFILAITLANFLILYRRNKLSEVENIRLKEEKTKAELTALKEQISPHFFFNTLSTLSSIIRNEKKEAGLDFIQDMSNTYRYALASGDKDLVTLDEELSFLNSYIFLLKKRFGEKLRVDIEIHDQHLMAKIPPMSLQILVENAIQHNVVTQSKPLNIRIYIQDQKLFVENKLQEKEAAEGFGLGLQNLSNRYELLAQKDISIEKEDQKFRVILPLL